jgi:disulfide bond formation protein DsbB
VISSTIGILAARLSLEAIPWAMVINFSLLIILFTLSLAGSRPKAPATSK